MANTTNLNLVKPAGTDYALVSVINGNMDIIDSKVGAVPSNASVQGQIDTLNNQIGNLGIVNLGNITSSAPIVANVSNSFVGLLVGNANTTGRVFLSLLRTSGGGAVNNYVLDSATYGSNISFDISTNNKLTITSSSSSATGILVIVINGTISKAS